jgi:hypothetical protein
MGNTGETQDERELRAAVIGYLHDVRGPEEQAVEERQRGVDQQLARRRPPVAPRPEATPTPGPALETDRREGPGRPPAAPPLPRRGPAGRPARPEPEPSDVTIDLREGERIGGIWQRAVEEPPQPTTASDAIPGSDRYAFSLAVGNSYCYACGRFAMHQIVLEANQPTRARRLGAYRCRCTLCEYLTSPQPSEIHRAEEQLAANKPGAWSRARRAVGVGHRTS